jgi:hypothetical protein
MIADGISVLYYHSIGDHRSPRPWSFLIISRPIFEQHIQYFTKGGYFFATLKELYEHMAGKKRLPKNTVVICFDDGFLDNYVIVLPLAKKYGFRFTVYVSPEFVQEVPTPRLTMEDVWEGKRALHELEWWGYLSWKEMEIMERTGLCDIQSHAMTHTWYPQSTRLVDFHHPGDQYYWLYWNKLPDRKPYWLNEYRDNLIPLGTPVFEHSKSLVVRRASISGNALQIVPDYVMESGGQSFFSRRGWREELKTLFARHTKGLYEEIETDEQQRRRWKSELAESKWLIEKRLNKKVEFLAWPGGGNSQELQNIAKEVGYLATTKGTGPNSFGTNPSRISRGSPTPGIKAPLWLLNWFLKMQLYRQTHPESFIAGIFSLLKAIAKVIKTSSTISTNKNG